MIAFLARQGFTRDDAKWIWLKVAGLAGLILSGAFDLSAFGLTEQQRHVVMAVCGVIAYLAGQMSTSRLPGRGASS